MAHAEKVRKNPQDKNELKLVSTMTWSATKSRIEAEAKKELAKVVKDNKAEQAGYAEIDKKLEAAIPQKFSQMIMAFERLGDNEARLFAEKAIPIMIDINKKLRAAASEFVDHQLIPAYSWDDNSRAILRLLEKIARENPTL
jgi:hypothetical protein